jgi:uncharacterized membrane protein
MPFIFAKIHQHLKEKKKQKIQKKNRKISIVFLVLGAIFCQYFNVCTIFKKSCHQLNVNISWVAC